MKIALLTCTDLPNLTAADQLLIPELAKHNIAATPAISSDKDIDWSTFDVLIFRNTWDYYEHQAEFDAWLQKIQHRNIATLNPLAVIDRNKHKFYLRELEQQGIKVIPTIYIDQTQNLNLKNTVPSHWQQAVIKPAYSGGSFQTELFDTTNIESINQIFAPIAAQKDLLLQQFMPEIKTLGETSFVFFDKKFSHAVNKQAVNNDFRIQQQYGGIYTLINASQHIINQAQAIVNTFSENLLYARVDGIVINNELHLMEVECLEPDLYLDLQPTAIQKFVAAIIKLTKSI